MWHIQKMEYNSTFKKKDGNSAICDHMDEY